MMKLTDAQADNFIKVWNLYMDGGDKYVYPFSGYSQKELDEHRLVVIPEVKKWLDKYLNGNVPADEFKTIIDDINKKNLLWGFHGSNGQVFLNSIVTTSIAAKLHNELNYLFKGALPAPVTSDFAINNIREVINFIRTLHETTADRSGLPKIESIPYFLSYFWQIQRPEIWPIYYTSMVNELKECEIWSPTENLAQSYSDFYELNNLLIDQVEVKTGKEVRLWDIEHAFYYSAILKTAPPVVEELAAETAVIEEAPLEKVVKQVQVATPATVRGLRKSTHEPPRPESPKPEMPRPEVLRREIPKSSFTESYIPPVVALLPALASKDAQVEAFCSQSGKTIENVYEERLAILFKMLGYETSSLGQGRGRVPDGLAACKEHHYAIIYDAEIRPQGYAMGAGEGSISEYIVKIGDRLRKQGFRTIYFMIVSSTFNDEYDDETRTLKIETGVNEVILAEVEALLVLLENKLRDPEVTLGPRHFQKLLADSGLLTARAVRDFFK